MLDASLNHASIMTWGWFNEGPSDKPAACPAYAACAARARARDPTRFGTWASSAKTGDACLEHASLVSFNSYPAWCALRPASPLHRPDRAWRPHPHPNRRQVRPSRPARRGDDLLGADGGVGALSLPEGALCDQRDGRGRHLRVEPQCDRGAVDHRLPGDADLPAAPLTSPELASPHLVFGRHIRPSPSLHLPRSPCISRRPRCSRAMSTRRWAARPSRA